MLIRSRIAALIAVAAAVGGLAAGPLPALAAPGRPAAPALPRALATREAPASRKAPDMPAASAAPAVPAAAIPSGAGNQLISDIQKAGPITDGSGVTVAVLSTGVDPAVPGLAGKVTTGPDYTGSAQPARIGGTLVAGLIAGNGPAASDDGLAPAARILSIRTDEDGNEPGANAFYDNTGFNDINGPAIQYAVDHGAQVIFIDSMYGYPPSQPLESAVHDAVARNVVIVAEDEDFGSGADGYDYPASMPGVIGVGSADLPGLPAPFDHLNSVRNESVLIAGPANSVSGVGPDGQDYQVDGPAAAAAFVAGTVALIKSLYPHLSPMLVARALALSARYHPPGGYNTTLGYGLINPYGALTEASQLAKLPGAAASPAGAASSPGGQDATATFRSGPPLPVIEAVHHPVAKLAGYGAAAAGVICLIAALLLWRRRRRAPGTGRPAPAGASQQLAEPQ